MLTEGEQTALAAIELQLEPIYVEITETTEHLKTLQNSKARLEAARVALSGTKSGKAKSGGKERKPSANKSTVMKVCLDIARQNAPISKDDLEALAKDKLSDGLNFSLTGVQLRLKECLADDAFNIAEDDMVSLATTN